MAEVETAELVRDRWGKMAQRMRQDDYDPYAWLAPLVEAMGQHPRIGQLFPYTSHDTLCLSRTTRYPWSNDCPHADAIGNDLFRVCGADYTIEVETYKEHRWKAAKYGVLGEGNVSQAVIWIDSALPPGCGPAIDGNLEDLRRFEGKSVMPPLAKALHTAVDKNDAAEVATLLRSGADINAADYGGLTPLIIAVLSRRTEMVRLLLKLGADVNACTEDNETALSLALFRSKDPEIVRLLEAE